MDEGSVSGKFGDDPGLRYVVVEVPPSKRHPNRATSWTVMRDIFGERESCGASLAYATEAEAQAVADDLNGMNKERLG